MAGYIVIRGEFYDESNALERAIAEAYKGWFCVCCGCDPSCRMSAVSNIMAPVARQEYDSTRAHEHTHTRLCFIPDFTSAIFFSHAF